MPDPGWGIRSVPYITSRYPLWDQPKLLERIDAGRYYIPDAEEGLRETIVSSAVDARPQYVARITGPAWCTIWAAIFTSGAFIFPTFHWYAPAIASIVAAIGCVIWWLWTATARVPEKDMKDAGLGLSLPVYVSGPAAVGWWGVFITMLGDMTAFASLVFGVFFYWTARPDFPPPGAAHPDGALVALAGALYLGAWGATRVAREVNAQGAQGRARGLLVGGQSWPSAARRASRPRSPA